jgi:hypothetical protein
MAIRKWNYNINHNKVVVVTIIFNYNKVVVVTKNINHNKVVVVTKNINHNKVVVVTIICCNKFIIWYKERWD